MNKGINFAYQELETTIVGQINRSGLPLFAVRDLLFRIMSQVETQYTAQVSTERKDYFDSIRAEKEAGKPNVEPEHDTAQVATALPEGVEETAKNDAAATQDEHR